MKDVDWLPDFFIAGFPKTGTSSLHRWIADHPDALGSRDKEAGFFVDPDSHVFEAGTNWRDGFAVYREQFVLPASGRPRVILESTPSYVYQATALAQIPDLPTRPRCLFMVREPADQIRSVYSYFRNNWTHVPQRMSFAEFLVAARTGAADFGGNELARHALSNARYVDFLRLWRDLLGPERMMVCTLDDLRTDAPALTRRIARWIGLDAAFYDSYGFPSENETYTPRSRLLHRANVAVRARLPRGRAYRALRGIYRRFNTVPGGGRVADDHQMAALREEFAEANAQLAAEFGLDLSRWSEKPAA